MGYQRRHARFIDGLEVPSPSRRERLDAAVDLIYDDVVGTGRAGIYTGDGKRLAPVDEARLGPLVSAGRNWTSGRLPDGRILLVGWPGDTHATIQERVYRAYGYATRHLQRRAGIVDLLYAAVGHGWAPPAPAAEVELHAELILTRIESGDWPRHLLAAHGEELRPLLGFPEGRWSPADERAAEQGRRLCSALGAETPPRRRR